MYICFDLPKFVLCVVCVHLQKTVILLRVESPTLTEILCLCFRKTSTAILRVALGESSCAVLRKTNTFCVLTLMAVVQISKAEGRVVVVLIPTIQLEVGLQRGRHNTSEIGRRKFHAGDLAIEHVGNKSSSSRNRNVFRCHKITFLPLLCKVSRERRCFKPNARSVSQVWR